MPGERSGSLSALEARSWAQFFAFGPFAFQALRSVRELGILSALLRAEQEGWTATSAALAEAVEVSTYAIELLLDVVCHLGVVSKGDEGWQLGKVGYFVLHDEMTQVNFDFVQHVCYDALPDLTASLKSERPVGLERLGLEGRLYGGLGALETTKRTSWLDFDHFYSGAAFDELLPCVFDRPVRSMADIGGNTGRWAAKCLNYDPYVHVTLVDLPAQLEMARDSLSGEGERVLSRLSFLEMDVLEGDFQSLRECDLFWMSQFLDCFSPQQIVEILKKVRAVASAEARLFIVEPFPDMQRFPVSAYCLDATSLYFNCLANGVSRFYRLSEMVPLIEAAGFVVEHQWPQVGHWQTALCCRASAPNSLPPNKRAMYPTAKAGGL
nr:class I SAM-dependent methyltransferase [Halorhodospira abdelmalekii]